MRWLAHGHRYNARVSTRTLGPRAGLARPSPTLAITARANAMKAAGIDVISFAAGEPDFNTPDPICQAAIDAIGSGFTKYTPTTGIGELKAAIVEKLRRQGLTYEPGQVVVSCGAKHSLFNALWVLLEPGDEVIVFAPFWATYADQIRLCGGVPVVVETKAENGFIPRLEDLKAKVGMRTKAILLNSPCNPTGAVFPRSVLKEIATVAIRHDLWIVSDEIYERLCYDEPHTSIASLGREVQDRTVLINGVSKTYSMTGWRIGYMAAPAEVTKAVSCFQDQVTSNPTSFAQKGAVVALTLPDESVEPMRREFQERRDLALDELEKIPGLVLPQPQGAFYVLFGVEAYLGGQFKTDPELAEYLLEQACVALIPGSAFEGPGFLRLSYTASKANIVRGIERIADALKRLE